MKKEMYKVIDDIIGKFNVLKVHNTSDFTSECLGDILRWHYAYLMMRTPLVARPEVAKLYHLALIDTYARVVDKYPMLWKNKAVDSKIANIDKPVIKPLDYNGQTT